MIEQAVVLDLVSHSQRLSCGFYQKARRWQVASFDCLKLLVSDNERLLDERPSVLAPDSPQGIFLSRWCNIRLATVATRYTTALLMKDLAQPTSMADQPKLSCRYSWDDLLLRCDIGAGDCAGTCGLSFALFSGLCLVADPIIGARRHGECARLV
jgi:hypothetical protein